MAWCISSLRSLCLSQRINIWGWGHQNGWVHGKVQEAAERPTVPVVITSIPQVSGDFFFFVLSMFCISFLSFRKTYDVSYWSDCFLKQCSWFSQPIKGERPEWPRVSMSQSGWGPDRGPETSDIKILSRADIAPSESLQITLKFCFVLFCFVFAKYTQPGLNLGDLILIHDCLVWTEEMYF